MWSIVGQARPNEPAFGEGIHRRNHFAQMHRFKCASEPCIRSTPKMAIGSQRNKIGIFEFALNEVHKNLFPSQTDAIELEMVEYHEALIPSVIAEINWPGQRRRSPMEMASPSFPRSCSIGAITMLLALLNALQSSVVS